MTSGASQAPKSASPPRSTPQPGSSGPGRRHRAVTGPDLLGYPYTDTGNAERLVAMFGDRIRYCPEWARWLVWEGTRWKPDQSGEIRRNAKLAVRTFYAQAAQIQDKDIRKSAESHARRSESAAAIRATLACAEYEKGITVNAADLDRDPWLLNCRNGTVHLRSGRLTPHRTVDLITKLCPVVFDTDAMCPQFLTFVERILGGRPTLITYLQRVIGYALTGSVSEKACFCLFGQGNNGKTTLLELLRYILGDYAAHVMIDSLMMKRSQESNASLADLADLRGARFVTTSETEEGQRLAEGKLKYLTGMNEIKTCRKYENPFTFAPTHKIFMDANHRPVVRGTDKAIWNRLKLIPFTVTIPDDEIDKALLAKLKAEASGVLAWAVNGCLGWQRDGLDEPREIHDSVDAWKDEDDPYKEFFDDRCEFGQAHSTPVATIWRDFSAWAEDNGIRFPSRTRLYERIRLQGCTQDRQRDANGRQVRCWQGVKVA